MSYPVRQRGHFLEAEFATLQAWSKTMVLVYLAERLHREDPGGFDPRAYQVKVKRVRTALIQDGDSCWRYRVWICLSHGYNYRLEWKRVDSLMSFFDAWERVPWSARGRGKGSVTSALRTQRRGRSAEN